MGGPGGIRLISDRDQGGGRDLYHRLFTATWPQFFGLFAAVYIFFNLVFAAIYLVESGRHRQCAAGIFQRFVFFQRPDHGDGRVRRHVSADLFTNLVVTVEVLLGIVTIAIATG